MAHLSRHDSLAIGIELQDELGRFNLWAGNIGVFAPLQASLDFRLIDVPDIRAQFLRQLDTLSITLTQLYEAAVQASTEENEDQQDEDATREADDSLLSEHDMVDLVQSIHVTIDWLHRLSNLVRKASFGSQNQRAARFPLEDGTGKDITERLADIFKHLIKRECCDISDQILHRLAQTMIIRRRRVLYRRSRQKRWVLQQEAYRPRNLDPPAQLDPLQEEHESGEDHESSEVTEEVEFEPEKRVHFAPSRLTVTTLDQQKYRKLAAPSQISRATTAPFQHNEKLLVPPRPRLAKEGEEFVCDYCCLILPSSEADDQDTWANHVKKDLDPYICVFDDCKQPYQIFSSSKEWLAHMRSEHRMSWRCVVRDHPLQAFETREAFLDHMIDVHPGRFRKEQLPFIAESSARALNPTLPACPFCAEDSGDIESHVAQHLCYFALISLPWPDQLDQDSEVVSGQEMNSSSSDDVERETLKDDLDDSPGFVDEWTNSLETEPEPLLDTPVSWPDIETIFSEPDTVLIEFAAQAARRATMAQNDNLGEPETLREEINQVREQLPNIVWNIVDMDTRLLNISLRGPWGFDGENIILKVKIDIPHAYPKTALPKFSIEKAAYMPEWVRDKLQREVYQICQQYSQRKETCLAAALAYLLGLHDLTSSLNMFNERGHALPLGDWDDDEPSDWPVPQPVGIESAKVADKYESTEAKKTEVRPKSGYLTKKGKTFGSYKSRFYVVEGPQLKYYDAAGGSYLGSINLQGAQIGNHWPHDEKSSAFETQYSHAMVILELKKDSRIRHVLWAENDEERDLWVKALSPWIDYADSEKEVRVAEHDRPNRSESQEGTPQPPTFLIKSYGTSSRFLPANRLGPYVSIASASIGSSHIDCRLDLPKTIFGTLGYWPAGIIYMDISIAAPQSNVQSVDITVTLDDKDPGLQQATQRPPSNTLVSSDTSVTLTNFFGPRAMGRRDQEVKIRDSRFKPQVEVMGVGIGGIGTEQKTTMTSDSGAWNLSGQLLLGKDSSPRSLRWHISNNPDNRSLRTSVIHTGFVFEGGGQPFCLSVEIEGKSSKISDRIRQTSIQLARANRSSSKRGKILLAWGDEHLLRPLYQLAKALPEAMDRANGLQVPMKTPDARLVEFSAVPSGHESDEDVDNRENFAARISNITSHYFEEPRRTGQSWERVRLDDTKNNEPKSPMPYSPPQEGVGMVGESPGQTSGHRDSQQQASPVYWNSARSLDTPILEGDEDLREVSFPRSYLGKKVSFPRFLREREYGHSGKNPISGSVTLNKAQETAANEGSSGATSADTAKGSDTPGNRLSKFLGRQTKEEKLLDEQAKEEARAAAFLQRRRAHEHDEWSRANPDDNSKKG